MIIDSIHERLKRSIYKLEEILIELEPMENLKDILIIKVLEIIFKETNQKSFLMKNRGSNTAKWSKLRGKKT